MRGPSLQKTALLSFALHLTAFLLVFFIVRQSNYPIVPSPYTVSLVSPEFSTGFDGGRSEELVRESRQPSAPTAPAAPAESPKRSKKETAKERQSVRDKIDALAAKKRKIDTLSRLREISLKAADGKRSAVSKGVAPLAGKGNSGEDYFSKMMNGIGQYFLLPPGVGKKGLETIVAIRILKDGTVIVQRIEKKSGSTLFDRVALQALAKANPLPPPPYEMEIGVRFFP